MALSTLAMVTLALSGVSASAPKHAPKHAPEPAPNQLETARLPQAAQRLEFGVEGDASAFKFAFADPVCHFKLSSHVHCHGTCTAVMTDSAVFLPSGSKPVAACSVLWLYCLTLALLVAHCSNAVD